MAKMICFQHSDYKGQGAPKLSCANCCHIYIEAIRNEREIKIESSIQETKTWIERKRREALSGFQAQKVKKSIMRPEHR